MPVVSAQAVIGMKKHPHASILLNYEGIDYSQGFSQIKKAFRALTKDNIPQPYISDDIF